VKSNYVDPAPPVPDGPELFSEQAQQWWQPMKSGGAFVWRDPKTGGTVSRKFIPAKIFDNEDMLRRNPKYLQKLLRLPEYRRRALLEGRWDIFEGQFFGMWRSDLHVIPPRAAMAPPADWKTAAGLDYGSITVMEVQTKMPNGTIINFAECYTVKETPEEKANDICDLIEERQLWNLTIFYDVDMEHAYKAYGAIETPIKVFKAVFDKRLGTRKPKLRIVSKKRIENMGFRIACNEMMKNYLSWSADEEGKITRPPRFLVAADCRHLIRTLPELSHDPDSFRGLDFDDDNGEDHPYDAAKMVMVRLGDTKVLQGEDPRTEEIPWYEEIGMANQPDYARRSWRDPFHL
jgi:hypothetical protein